MAHWRTAASKVELTRVGLSGADEALVRIRSVYAGGGAGLLDLLDARRQLDDARRRLTDARFEARRARYQALLP